MFCVHMCSLLLVFSSFPRGCRGRLETLIGSNAKWKSVYRRNNIVGAGYRELFTCVKGYYLQKHHQREAAPRWLMQVYEKGRDCLCKQNIDRTKSKGDLWRAPSQLAAIKNMHQSHMAQMWTVMNRLLTRCGDKNKHDKELEWLWQPKW